MCSSIQSLHVFWVHRDSSGGVFDHLIPVAEGVVASGSVGVINGIGSAKNGFSVKLYCLVVVFGAVCLVPSSLQFACIVVSILLIISTGKYRQSLCHTSFEKLSTVDSLISGSSSSVSTVAGLGTGAIAVATC